MHSAKLYGICGFWFINGVLALDWVYPVWTQIRMQGDFYDCFCLFLILSFSKLPAWPTFCGFIATPPPVVELRWGHRLIICRLPWQRPEFVQLEEHNELNSSNCACTGVSRQSSDLGSVEPRHTRLDWLVQAMQFWLAWPTEQKCAFCGKCTLILSPVPLCLHPWIMFHLHNIHWLVPTALKPFSMIMALGAQ